MQLAMQMNALQDVSNYISQTLCHFQLNSLFDFWNGTSVYFLCNEVPEVSLSASEITCMTDPEARSCEKPSLYQLAVLIISIRRDFFCINLHFITFARVESIDFEN